MHTLPDICIILPILGLVVHPQIYVRAGDSSLGNVGDPRIEDAKRVFTRSFRLPSTVVRGARQSRRRLPACLRTGRPDR